MHLDDLSLGRDVDSKAHELPQRSRLVSLNEHTTTVSPLLFDRLWWMVIVTAAAILIIGRLTKAFEVGHIAAVLAATVLTLGGWFLVQRWGFYNLYELVPAFALAAVAAFGVSALFRVEEYKKPEFEVKVEAGAARIVPGTEVKATISAPFAASSVWHMAPQLLA